LGRLLLTLLCLVLLSLNLNCLNPVLFEEDNTGFLNLNIGIIRPRILTKTKAIISSDTTIQLKTLYFKFVNGSDTIKDSMSMLSLNIRNDIILPIRNYTLKGLKTWRLEVKGLDIIDSVIYYDTTSFKIEPSDTINVNINLKSRYTIFVARFISISNKIKTIQKLELRIDNVIRGDIRFNPKVRVFDEYFAYKYFQVGVSHNVQFIAYSSGSNVAYSGGGDFSVVSGQDLSITFPLN
jgi:hypothetical protein